MTPANSQLSQNQLEILTSGSIEKLPLPSLVCSVISSSLSLISAAILIFLLLNRARTQLPILSRRLFLYLTLSDLLTALGCLVGVIRYIVLYYMEKQQINLETVCSPDGLCITQSMTTLFAMLSSGMWTLMIAVFFMIKVTHEGHPRTQIFHTAMGFFMTSCWGLPAIMVAFAGSMLVLGEGLESNVGWCSIKESNCTRGGTSHCPIMTPRDRLLWILWTGKLWEFIIYLLAMVLSAVTYYKIKIWNQQLEWDFIVVEEVGSSACDSVQPMSIREPIIQEEERLFLLMPWTLSILRCGGTLHFVIIALKTIDSPSLQNLDDPSRTYNKIFQYYHVIGSTTQALCNLLLLLYFCPQSRKSLFPCRRATTRENVNGGGANPAFQQEEN